MPGFHLVCLFILQKPELQPTEVGKRAPDQLFLCLVNVVWCLILLFYPPGCSPLACTYANVSTAVTAQSSSQRAASFCRGWESPAVHPGSLEDGLSQNSLVIRNTWTIAELSFKNFF